MIVFAVHVSWAKLLKTELLAYLACPKCRASLVIASITEQKSENGVDEIVHGSITCANGHHFSIQNGVPRMVLSELSGVTDMHTGVKFSESWEQFSRFQPDYIQQFFDWLSPVDKEFVHGKTVLDAGCGKGRHARVVAESGAKVVIAVDIGTSVDVAYRNLRAFKNVHVVQGDIKALPFKPVFDFVYSTGVLHHMQDPKLGFKSLAPMLKPKGALAVWVYGKENNWWIETLINPVRVACTSRMPRPILRILSMSLASVVFLSARLIYRPWHALRRAVKVLPPLFYETYLVYISHFDFEEIDHIVYDHLVAPVAFYLGRDTVRDWLSDSDFKVSNLRWHNQNSWTLVASYDEADRDRFLNLDPTETRPLTDWWAVLPRR